MIPVCADCRYYEVNWLTKDGVTAEDNEGECHEDSPKPGFFRKRSKWPITPAHEWCGKHEALQE